MMDELKRILLVEDEESMAIGLEYNLSEEGYLVCWAKDGKEALEFIHNDDFDLIVLDIMLPYYNGFELAETIRKKSPQIPILFLSARKRVQDRIKGLKIGADDYMTKPFHLEELLLRIKGMLKRKNWYKAVGSRKIYKFGNNEVNFENLNCVCESGNVKLTHHEALVLKYLVDHKGEIVSRKELLENVWHMDKDVETRTVDNFIVRLRKYFEPNPSQPQFLKSVRSAGYIFED